LSDIGVTFLGTVNKVSSSAASSGGGFKVTFDVPESDAEAAAELMRSFLNKVVSVAVVIPPQG
jgi:hypothetical protein